eukprot:TRINITY_DN93_c0_g3_i1.p1 TRINITY_DN93_c0_g3~~TRINITY_DN93_c0_g3_i1.p1  ORF type:complete len:530 (-),score=85.58 TRINITY_DN93_c0_g3_i1:629-2218(-)
MIRRAWFGDKFPLPSLPVWLNSNSKVGVQWVILVLAFALWRETTYTPPQQAGLGLGGLDTLMESDPEPGEPGGPKLASWERMAMWKNVSAGMDQHPQLNLSHPLTKKYAASLEGMMLPFSRIPGETWGMGSKGMVGARMLHIMGQKSDTMACAGHIRILNGTVYFRYGGFVGDHRHLFRFHQSIKLLQDTVDWYNLGALKVELFLNVCDFPISFLSAIDPYKAGFPFFSTQWAFGTTDIIIPDPVDFSPSAATDRSMEPLWRDKVAKAVFRGPSNNYDLADYNWRASPRFRLHRLTDTRPDLLDARLTRLERLPPQHLKKMENEEINLGEEMDAKTRGGYKYEVVVDDGVGTTKLCGVLASGHVAFKQDSSFSQFFFPFLKPGVHFLPVDHHFRNLIQAVEYAQKNDAAMEQMLEMANIAARYVCSWEGRALYWAIALVKYEAEAMEDPDDVHIPLTLCNGRAPHALSRPFEGFSPKAPKCGTPEAESNQPKCAYYCSDGEVVKAKWQWLSSASLSEMQRAGPRLEKPI